MFSQHYNTYSLFHNTLIKLSLCPIIGKQRNTNVGTHLCQFLPSLRSSVRIHCPLLLMRNDDDDQLLLLLANEDKLTSAAHRKSASPLLYNTKGFPVGDLSVTHLMLLSVAMAQPMPLVVLLLFASFLPSLANETGLQYEPPPRQGFTFR